MAVVFADTQQSTLLYAVHTAPAEREHREYERFFREERTRCCVPQMKTKTKLLFVYSSVYILSAVYDVTLVRYKKGNLNEIQEKKITAAMSLFF